MFQLLLRIDVRSTLSQDTNDIGAICPMRCIAYVIQEGVP